jgi:hypothetical protein
MVCCVTPAVLSSSLIVRSTCSIVICCVDLSTFSSATIACARNTHETDTVAAVAAVAAFPDDGSEQPPGLSRREIDRLAKEVEDWAYEHRDEVDLTKASVVEAEIRRRLAGTVFPEAIEIEVERVTRSLFE